MVEDLEPAIEKVVSQIGKLTLVAPRDGQVMGVPQRETRGQYLKPGKPFIEIGDPRKLEAHLILDQTDVDLDPVERARTQATAWIKLYATSETDLEELRLRDRPPEPRGRRSPPS